MKVPGSDSQSTAWFRSANCDAGYGIALLCVVALILGLTATGQAGVQALRYERAGLAAHQWWRLLSPPGAPGVVARRAQCGGPGPAVVVVCACLLPTSLAVDCRAQRADDRCGSVVSAPGGAVVSGRFGSAARSARRRRLLDVPARRRDGGAAVAAAGREDSL